MKPLMLTQGAGSTSDLVQTALTCKPVQMNQFTVESPILSMLPETPRFVLLSFPENQLIYSLHAIMYIDVMTDWPKISSDRCMKC